MVHPSVLCNSVGGLALSKSIDTSATAHKGLFGVQQLYTVSNATSAIFWRFTCHGLRSVMSHHDASPSDNHFYAICWMLANQCAEKHK